MGNKNKFLSFIENHKDESFRVLKNSKMILMIILGKELIRSYHIFVFTLLPKYTTSPYLIIMK